MCPHGQGASGIIREGGFGGSEDPNILRVTSFGCSLLPFHKVGPEHCTQIALIKSRGPKGDQAWLKSSWAMS